MKMKMNKMHYALTDFCINQDNYRTASENTIATMVGELLDYCDERISSADIETVGLYNYFLQSLGNTNYKIFPNSIGNDGMICKNSIPVCFVTYNEMNVKNTNIVSGYEIVYDCDDDIIRLIYKVSVCDSNIRTVYRTEIKKYENFDFFGFFAEITYQLKYAIDKGMIRGRNT